MNYPDVVIREPLTYIERQLAAALVKLGYEVEILPGDPSIDSKYIRPDNYHALRVSFLNNLTHKE